MHRQVFLMVAIFDGHSERRPGGLCWPEVEESLFNLSSEAFHGSR